ncbi:hypothetical protein VKT23_000957 [Stygiomarasmius scandens]|uniref:Uncharacterized protein n=1 Tax=Marasmiellus scandens TaxID=2682957 RepID=A0ABR1K886_9AGAR
MSTTPQLANFWSDVASLCVEEVRKLIAASFERVNNLEEASDDDRVAFARHNPFMVHWHFTFDRQRKQGAPDWAMATFVKACEAAYQVFPMEAVRARYGVTWVLPEKDIPRLMERDYGFWTIDTRYGLGHPIEGQPRVTAFQEPGSTSHPQPFLPYKGYLEEPSADEEEPITSKSTAPPTAESSTPSTFLPPKPVVEVSPPQKVRSEVRPKRKQAGGDDKTPAKVQKTKKTSSAPSTAHTTVPRPILKKTTPRKTKAVDPDMPARRVTRSQASSVASMVAPTDDELPDLSDPSIPPESDAASSAAPAPTRQSTRRKTPTRTSRTLSSKVARKGKGKAVAAESEAEQTEAESEDDDSQYTFELPNEDAISKMFAKFRPVEEFPLDKYGYKSESAYGKKKKAIITFTPASLPYAYLWGLAYQFRLTWQVSSKPMYPLPLLSISASIVTNGSITPATPQGPVAAGSKITIRKCNCCQQVGQSCTATYPISKLMLTKDLLSTFSLNSTHELSQRLSHVLELQNLRSKLREQANALVATIRSLDDQIAFGQAQLRECSVDPTILVSQLAQGEGGALALDEHTLHLLSVAAGWEANNLEVPSRLQLNEETGEYECVPLSSGLPSREPSPFVDDSMDVDEEPPVAAPGGSSVVRSRSARKAASTSPTVSKRARDKGKEVAQSLSASTTPRRPSVSFKDPSSSEPDV